VLPSGGAKLVPSDTTCAFSLPTSSISSLPETLRLTALHSWINWDERVCQEQLSQYLVKAGHNGKSGRKHSARFNSVCSLRRRPGLRGRVLRKPLSCADVPLMFWLRRIAGTDGAITMVALSTR
jgi:hypothetical protein